MNKSRKIAIEIIEQFEDLLDLHGIKIPDDYREGNKEEACIYGITYWALEDDLTELLQEYFKVIHGSNQRE